MQTALYSIQAASWPTQGRHILARFDDESIHVYQAYRPAIAEYAVANQQFGGEFSYSRMSWIKPNFLWMMYRCGWAIKEGQERVLAVRLRRAFFDELLGQVVPSGYDPERFRAPEQWKHAVANSNVRLQWDPDHDPAGRPLTRRAVQLGLRGEALRRYGSSEILSVEDITPFVAEQREHLQPGFRQLLTPLESVYAPEPDAAKAVGIDCTALEGSTDSNIPLPGGQRERALGSP